MNFPKRFESKPKRIASPKVDKVINSVITERISKNIPRTDRTGEIGTLCTKKAGNINIEGLAN